MATGAVPDDVLVALRRGATVLAYERTLPVLGVLSAVVPDAALVRGQVVVVRGVADVSLALALAAEPTRTGSWLAVVERPDVFELGGDAASELGVMLERVVVVTLPHGPTAAASGGGRGDAVVAEALATLIEGFDVVMMPAGIALAPQAVRRLQARLRTRGGVLIVVGGSAAWQPDLVLWSTPVGDRGGWVDVDDIGRLVRRRLVIEVQARRRGRPTRHGLWLPGEGGEVVSVAEVDRCVISPGAVSPGMAWTG